MGQEDCVGRFRADRREGRSVGASWSQGTSSCHAWVDPGGQVRGRSEGLRKANTFNSLAREEKKLLIQLMLNVALCRDASERNAQARHVLSHLFMAV